jgi:beta-phosphoglucomutase-like phosphatase (HAD superfamily)
MRPGVKRLLGAARAAGLRLAIATTTTPENVTALLEHSLAPGAESWFEVIGAGDIVPAKKPAPDIYLWVLERMKLRPEQCLAFEDSGNGIRASRGANLKTVITTNDYTADHNFAEALVVLSDMGEPSEPFNVLRGDAYGKSCVDLDLLRNWHAN